MQLIDCYAIGHWALVLSVRVASRREAVGAASRREVLGIGHWLLILLSPSSPSSSPLPTPYPLLRQQ